MVRSCLACLLVLGLNGCVGRNCGHINLAGAMSPEKLQALKTFLLSSGSETASTEQATDAEFTEVASEASDEDPDPTQD